MTINEFETMLARAGYRLATIYKDEDGEEIRRLYEAPGRPGLNIPIESGRVDSWTALKVEAYLDEKEPDKDKDDD